MEFLSHPDTRALIDSSFSIACITSCYEYAICQSQPKSSIYRHFLGRQFKSDITLMVPHRYPVTNVALYPSVAEVLSVTFFYSVP